MRAGAGTRTCRVQSIENVGAEKGQQEGEVKGFEA